MRTFKLEFLGKIKKRKTYKEKVILFDRALRALEISLTQPHSMDKNGERKALLTVVFEYYNHYSSKMKEKTIRLYTEEGK